MEKTQKRYYIVWGICAGIICILFFGINYYTPYLADDFHYSMHFYWGNDGVVIQSFSDFCHSLKNFYLGWGGRVCGYLFTLAFSYLPNGVFSLINTVAYMLVVQLIYLICGCGKNKHCFSLWMGIHLLLWFCVPDYGQVMFWMCGSANYLWTSLLVLLNIYLYKLYAEDRGILRYKSGCIPAFLIGVFAGWAMENMSAAMLVILTLYICYYRKYKIKINLSVICGYIGSVLGFALLYFAPGNGARKNMEGDKYSAIFKFAMIDYYWVMFVGGICILWIVLYFVWTNKTEKDVKAKNQSMIYLVAAVISAYCMIAAPTSPERTWFIVCVYGILAVGVLYSNMDIQQNECMKKTMYIIALGGALVFAVQAVDTMYCSKELSDQTAAREVSVQQQIAEGKKDIVVAIITHKYPFRAKHDALEGLSDIKTDPNYWINQTLAKYYGVNSITGIEQ